MEKRNSSVELKDEITFFRQKLDNLLADPNSTSEEILALSQELDALIVKYYIEYGRRILP